jgi:hypothetical protein
MVKEAQSKKGKNASDREVIIMRVRINYISVLK